VGVVDTNANWRGIAGESTTSLGPRAWNLLLKASLSMWVIFSMSAESGVSPQAGVVFAVLARASADTSAMVVRILSIKDFLLGFKIFAEQRSFIAGEGCRRTQLLML